MLLECSRCEATVDAIPVADYDHYDPEEGPPVLYSFLRCPVCSGPFIAVQEDYGEGFAADHQPGRLYPPVQRVSGTFPDPVLAAFNEAQVCLKNKAYVATAIMCRKTLEAVCSDHSVTGGTLANSLNKMRDKGLLDPRLFEWAEALRIAGNEAAHDVAVSVSVDDAKDYVEFTDALLQYVYTFRDKFKSFQDRRASGAATGSVAT